ncbi:MAG TPA: T9SS type A sorting domain-containing protein [Cytophagaceae bacterium]|nr:T9SS type A sorting domain-containing protein [Cytophagaceae bacterium]
MLKNSIVYYLLLCFISVNSFSQAIYSGGNADGFATTCFMQANNASFDIYSGGRSDGFATACFSQANNSSFAIYGGGNSDGFATTCFLQANNSSLAIYGGGNSDGFATTCFLQANNSSLDIYSGGNNDGFVKACYLQNPPLPIQLLSFEANAYSDYVLTSWETASEKNNDFFTLEKTKDGVNYFLVANIKGAGNSLQHSNYSYPDYAPFNGTSYYRLKQTDYNGKFSYSQLVAVNFSNTNETSFNIYPNPSSGEDLMVALNGQKEEEVLVVLYDMLGEIIYSKVYILADNGITVSAFDPFGEIASGIYAVIATFNDKSISKKIVIK